MCMYVCIYIYIYTHVYIYIYICIPGAPRPCGASECCPAAGSNPGGGTPVLYVCVLLIMFICACLFICV